MAKKRGQQGTRLDTAAVAVGSALGTLVARIQNLTRQREAITSELQRYAKQAEGVLRGLATRETRFASPVLKAAKKAAPARKRTTVVKTAGKKRAATAPKARSTRKKAAK